MRNLILVLFLSIISNCCDAQAPVIQWERSFGGANPNGDQAYLIQKTADLGYIICGFSASNDGDVTGNHGNTDYWIVKLNDTGSIQWQKSLGGSNSESAFSIQQTSDGGYIIAGRSTSNDGDVTGNHGNNDYWLVKVDDTGAIQWQTSLGGSSLDNAYSIQQTFDGGFIVVGYSSSNDGNVSGNHGNTDYWVVKLNDTGAINWKKCFGGSNTETGYPCIKQTFDGGYIFCGSTSSNDGDVSGNHGGGDCWVLKLNDTGNIQWKKCYGGSGTENANAIRQTSDSGYIFTGVSNSVDGDVTGNHGGNDFWVVKLNDTGAIQWEKSLGGSQNEGSYSVEQTLEGGYIVGGSTNSNDGDVTLNHGNGDYWLVKLSSTGSIQWQKSVGGSNMDQAYSIVQTIDGGYAVAGYSTSNDWDVSGNHGATDYWVVKLTCGLHAGTITGLSTLCTGSTTLIDTASGGTWSASNGHATVSGGVVTAISTGIDTIFYTVSNTCGSAVASFTINITCPVEINTIPNPAYIAIHPNPTTGIISIAGANNATLKVYNTIGQLITSANNTDNISIAEFPTGLYFVRVFSEQGELLKQEKVVKQ